MDVKRGGSAEEEAKIRFRRDIFGDVNGIYVANIRKLKAFLGAGRVQWDRKKHKKKIRV